MLPCCSCLLALLWLGVVGRHWEVIALGTAALQSRFTARMKEELLLITISNSVGKMDSNALCMEGAKRGEPVSK